MNGVIIIVIILFCCSVLVIGGIFTLGWIKFFTDKKKEYEEQQQKLQEEEQEKARTQQKLLEDQERARQQQTTPLPTQPSLPKNVCDRGPKSILKNNTCAQIAAVKYPKPPLPPKPPTAQNNPIPDLNVLSQAMGVILAPNQNEWMINKGIDFNKLGYKYDGEECWSEPIENCIIPGCITPNKTPRELAICKLRYMAAIVDINTDPWSREAMQKYGISIKDI